MHNLGVTSELEAYFKGGLWGWLSSQWRKLAMLWGFSDTLNLVFYWTSDGTTPYNVDATTVPADEVWIVNSARCRHSDPVARATYLYVYGDGNSVLVDGDQALAQWLLVGNTQPLILGPGFICRMTIFNLALGQTAYFFVHGYRMKIA